MKRFYIKKGLELPISGKPTQEIEGKLQIKTVGINGPDYIGMKPTMRVKVGDTVAIGQPLFNCKKSEGVVFTSPVSGKIIEINRGDKRIFESIVISNDGKNNHAQIKSFKGINLDYKREDIKNILIETGLWISFRTRPFSKIPNSCDENPRAIFVNALDTNPLAVDPKVVIKQREEDFIRGVSIISKLTDNKVYLCTSVDSNINVKEVDNIVLAEFYGKHPAGLVGTHIHHLFQASLSRVVWHISYQDVIAIGKLFSSGKIDNLRVVSMAGPSVKKPRLVRTIMGANLIELLEGEIKSCDYRIISGSVFNGRTVENKFLYLGRYHQQVIALSDEIKRKFLGWMSVGFDKFSVKKIFASKLFPKKLFDFNTSTNGSKRAMVPIGMYESVMPGDFLPTQLLRALITLDVEQAEQLGCLELDEEDLSLCTFVCPGKYNYGPILRKNLDIIEKEYL